jgi:hypothetical protein
VCSLRTETYDHDWKKATKRAYMDIWGDEAAERRITTLAFLVTEREERYFSQTSLTWTRTIPRVKRREVKFLSLDRCMALRG